MQAAGLSALSNTLAQIIKAYRNDVPITLNTTQLFQFIFFTLCTCPMNFLWQQYLEEQFPGKTILKDGSIALNKANTVRKFALDQTIGAVLNTVLFIATFTTFRGGDIADMRMAVLRDTFPLMRNGWKLWPIVSIFNFTLVPVHRRTLVGGCVGLFWGIYLSLIAGS